jgi:hypothetical protein
MAIARSPSCCAGRAGQINANRVERIWQREGLKVPHKQTKRSRLWLTDGSCIRLRPEQRNHVWSYDFVEDRTHREESRKSAVIAAGLAPRSSAAPVAPTPVVDGPGRRADLRAPQRSVHPYSRSIGTSMPVLVRSLAVPRAGV